MKYGKRLLAVMMVLVMILTIVPLTMFAFALDGNGTSAEPYQIKTYAELKALLEGLGGDGYPADAYYRLENDIDPLHDWVFASADNQKTAAEDLGMSPIVTHATYRAATQEDINDTSVQLYEFNGTDHTDYTAYTAYTGDRPAAPDGYYVVDTPESSTDAPLTEEQFAALTSAQRKTILQNNNDVIPSITPKNTEFYGTFDGNNKTIKGLQIHVNATQAAMFFALSVKKDDDGNVLSTGTVKNLTVDDTSLIGLVSANTAVAVSAGTVASTNTGIIQNVTSNATINVMVKLPVIFVYAGGITGRNDSADKGAVITDCIFGGTLNFIVAEASFSGSPKYSSIDSSSISLGGIAGGSESAITGTFSGNIKANYVGGINEEINGIYAGDTVYDGDATHDMTPEFTQADKRVGSVDADVWFNDGDITKSELDSNKYQLITQTKDGNKTYYVRQLVCAHNNAVKHDPVAPTCAATGNVEYWECPDCNNYFLINPTGNATAASCKMRDTTVPVSKTHPDAQHKDAVAATCKAKGNIEHWYCPTCNKYFLEDPTATENVTAYSQSKVQTPIDKNAHSPGEWEPYQAATTTSNATEKQVCTLCGKIVATREVPGTIVPDVVPKSGNGYAKDSTGKYLITALPTSKSGISVSQFKNSLVTGTYVVRDENGNEVTSGVVKTGYTVEVSGYPETKLIIAVKGDANKDGKISALDYVKVKNHILKKIDLSKDKAAYYAANANGDSKISALDYVKIKNLILKG